MAISGRKGGVKRKQRAILFLILLILLLSGGFFAPPSGAAEKAPTLTFVQMNDVYELFPVPTVIDGRTVPRGGLAHAATLIGQIRGGGPTLLLHAGDFLFPSLLSNKLRHQGAQMIAAFNLLGVDLATFGNHEFDQGCRVLAARVKESRFPWVSANIDFPKEAGLPAEKVQPYRVLKMAGLRIGILGLTLPLQPVGGCGPAPITFRDPIGAARAAVAKLKKEKADFIVALTHLPMADDRALAAAVPEIDLVVGGHDHEALEASVGKTLITKAGENATALGLIGIEATRSGPTWVIEKSWRRAPVDPSRTPPDPAMQAALAGYATETASFDRVVGETAVALDLREETVREGESNFGNYVADVLRLSMKADAALINGGAVRDDRILPPGPVTQRDLDTALPYQNEIVAVEVTGRQLIEALENGVSLSGKRAGRFPQVSGIAFSFDPHRPPGTRIVEATIGGAPPEPDRKYRLATIDFLARRGEIDGYAFKALPIIGEGGPLNEAIVRDLKARGALRTTLERRIVRVPEN